MRSLCLLLLSLAMSATCLGAESSTAATRPLVPGFERFPAPQAGPVRGGQLLLGELNCASCHKLDKSAESLILAKKAPNLGQVAARVKLPWLRAFLASPHQVKPGTTMPELFVGLPAEEKTRQVEAIVQFLATTGAGPLLNQHADRAAVIRGEGLFHQVGCVACHGALKPDAPALNTSVPLGKLDEKYTIATLAQFLRDPLAVRPSGRMPALMLTEQEARDVASYFLKNVEGVANFAYRLYEGSWDKLPDFTKLAEKRYGTATGLDVEVSQRNSNFGLRFEGFLPITKDARYKFHLGSDDGSKLSIDGQLIVDCDGAHPHSWKSGEAQLKPGLHAIQVDYFNAGGDQSLELELEGGGLPRQSVASLAMLTKEAQPVGTTAHDFKHDPALVEQGRELFASVGCVSCHDLREAQPVKVNSPKLASIALVDANPARGCLAAHPARPAPNYALSTPQRESLAAAIKALAREGVQPLTTAEVIGRTMTTFNCYACHVRDGVGGVEIGRNDFFQTTVKEMGDEGRIPPLLNGVGNKLTNSWFKKVFDQGAKDRPYMLAKMPRFGMGNVGPLVQAFQSVDGVLTAPPVEFDLPSPKVKAVGRHLVGNKAFSCIKCHNFDKHKGEGIPGIDMTILTERLQESWFRQYVRDPQTMRPGTRMPSAWPKEGRSQLLDLFDGDSDRQIASIWTFLSDGTKAAAPPGTGSHPIELIAFAEPVIYRNFIEGAGPRAIGVGYSEKVNLAFDANNLRLAMLWQGAFIDAGRHWDGRGAGFQPPLGDNVLPLCDGVPLAQLNELTTAWPGNSAKEQGYQFRGYRLGEKRRPTFLYSWNGLSIEDSPEPVVSGKEIGLRRSLAFSAEQRVANVWFRAAVGREIKPLADGWHQIDGLWKLRIQAQGNSESVVRASNNRFELLVPVILNGNKALIVEEFAW